MEKFALKLRQSFQLIWIILLLKLKFKFRSAGVNVVCFNFHGRWRNKIKTQYINEFIASVEILITLKTKWLLKGKSSNGKKLITKNLILNGEY